MVRNLRALDPSSRRGRLLTWRARVRQLQEATQNLPEDARAAVGGRALAQLLRQLEHCADGLLQEETLQVGISE